MPRWRSSSSLRRLRSASERNISATHVLLQSNLSPSSRAAMAMRTAFRFAPQVLQNFNSSLWLEPHCGQNIFRAPFVRPAKGTTKRGRRFRPGRVRARAGLHSRRPRVLASECVRGSGGGLPARERDDLLGGVLHAVRDGEVHARLAYQAPALFDVRPFEADDDGDLDADGLRGLDDAARDHVRADDAAEDVYQHGAHVRVGEQDAEGSLDALLRGAAAHVEEVGGLAARELDDVHRRHREAGAVHHAGDVAVELYVVEVVLRRLYLKRLLLVQVAQVLEVRVSEHRVVVEGHLRVEREEAAVLRQEERVYLDERGVGLLVRAVERLHELRRLVDELRREAEAERELARLEGAEA